MIRKLIIASTAAIAASVGALAETKGTAPAPGMSQPTRPEAGAPTRPEAGTPPPAAAAPAPAAPISSTTGSVTLSDDQAKAWVDKVVYSSDSKNLGEVASIKRDTKGLVTELHADIGGLLGMAETRVRLQPGQFKFDHDKVVLNMTAEQAKSLPKIEKN